MKTPTYCRHCGVIVLIEASPATVPCPVCGTTRLYRLRLPPIVARRIERESDKQGVARNVCRV